MTSYTHAGVSRLNGEFKVRFANDSTRVKILIKNGHTDIDIIELKHPMGKAEAVDYLLSIDFDNGNAEVRAALEAAREKRTEKPKAEKAPKAEPKLKVKAKPSMEKIRARKVKDEIPAGAETQDLDDKPF